MNGDQKRTRHEIPWKAAWKEKKGRWLSQDDAGRFKNRERFFSMKAHDKERTFVGWRS